MWIRSREPKEQDLLPTVTDAPPTDAGSGSPGPRALATTGDREAVQPALLSLRDVTRSFGQGSQRRNVLCSVSMDVHRGQAVRVQGANGAGKTTLLRIVTGMLAPHAGTVIVDGIQMGDDWREYHRRIGFLSAGDRGLYPRLSVRAHLEYVARISFVPRTQHKEAVRAALRLFDLTELEGRRSDRMSQGQRQRLRLALAFVHGPKLLVLDEPRNSLDDAGVKLLSAAVEGALDRGGAVLWCAPVGEDQPVEFDADYVIRAGQLEAMA